MNEAQHSKCGMERLKSASDVPSRICEAGIVERKHSKTVEDSPGREEGQNSGMNGR